MSEHEKRITPLIIDRPTLVSKTQYFTEWSLHILGWIAWMVLIRPLIILILWYIAYRFFNYQMFKLEGIDNPQYFGIGAGVLVLIYFIMFAWSRYNAWRFRGKDRRKSCGLATTEDIARYYKMRPEDIASLQKSKNLDFYFPDGDSIEIDDGRRRIVALYSPFDKSKHQSTSWKLDQKDLSGRSVREIFRLLAPYTRGHSIRISRMTVTIARKMGIEDRGELHKLRIGALYHDIGKVLIPSSILENPDPLSNDELAIIRKHPELSLKIMHLLPDSDVVSKIILHHHENWDGSGYPYGIKGINIPLGARICGITDMFDAMRTDRSYSRKRPFSQVLAEINACSGTKFDPEVVKVFNSCAEEFNRLIYEE